MYLTTTINHTIYKNRLNVSVRLFFDVYIDKPYITDSLDICIWNVKNALQNIMVTVQSKP